MNLQTITINKIDAFGGIQKLNHCIEKCIIKANTSDRLALENLIMYLNTLYEIKVDIEYDLITYNYEALETIKTLNHKIKERDCSTSFFLKALLQSNMDSVSGVRKIA